MDSQPEIIILQNPSSDPFTTTYDINGDGHALEFTIHSKEIVKYPKALGEHMRKHLAEELVWKQGLQGSNFEDEFRKMKEKITITL
jgi:hypothetical protein